MRFAALFCCAAVLATAAVVPSARADDVPGVGDAAPDFSLQDAAGNDVSLASFRGKSHVLVAFYPKDFSPGCTNEMKCLGREHRELEKLGVQVLGISADAPESHKRFASALGLRFPLLSDAEMEVAKAYGVFTPSPTGGFAVRSVFLVDREGKLVHVDRDYTIPRKLAGTPLGDAVDALTRAEHDPLSGLADLPEQERSGKTVLGRLVLAVLAEDAAAIEGLLHADFGARPSQPAEEARRARQEHLDRWKRTFEEEDFGTARFSAVLDLDAVKVLPRDDATAAALRSFGADVRTLAAGMRGGDLLVVVRSRGLASDDGTRVLSPEIALDLRKEGEEWRIAALCGR